MSFRFTAEDFEGYVKRPRGEHIWDEVKTGLRTEFGQEFRSAFYRRYEPLEVIWFAPKGPPSAVSSVSKPREENTELWPDNRVSNGILG